MSRKGENIHKRKDGRWEGRYIKYHDSAGKAIYGSVYGKSYTEVRKKLNEFKYLIATNKLPQNEQTVSFGEVIFLWLEKNRFQLKDQSYSKYRQLIELHILPELGNHRASDIDSDVLNNFLIGKLTKGRSDGTGGLAPSYVKTMSFILSSCVEYAVKKGYCRALSDDLLSLKNRKAEIKVFSLEEQKKIENHMRSNFSNRNIGILLSLYTGMRLGEVCALMWEDIDFNNQIIHVKHTINRIINQNAKKNEPKTRLVIDSAKTFSSDRIVPIPAILTGLLKRKKSNKPYVMVGNKYPFVDPRTYENYFHKCLKECDIRDNNYHTLRHTFATRCIEAGMDIKSLSEILGHASVNITLNTYVHSSLEQKRKQLNAEYVCGQFIVKLI